MGLLASRLEPKERHFVRALVRTGDVKEAGLVSGVGRPWEAIERPELREAICEHTVARLQAAAPVALNVLIRIMTDETAPLHVRRLAASDVLERAGYTGRNAETANGAGTIPLADMAPAALRDLVGRLESELAERASAVVGAVVDQSPAVLSDKPLNILD